MDPGGQLSNFRRSSISRIWATPFLSSTETWNEGKSHKHRRGQQHLHREEKQMHSLVAFRAQKQTAEGWRKACDHTEALQPELEAIHLKIIGEVLQVLWIFLILLCWSFHFGLDCKILWKVGFDMSGVNKIILTEILQQIHMANYWYWRRRALHRLLLWCCSGASLMWHNQWNSTFSLPFFSLTGLKTA